MRIKNAVFCASLCSVFLLAASTPCFASPTNSLSFSGALNDGTYDVIYSLGPQTGVEPLNVEYDTNTCELFGGGLYSYGSGCVLEALYTYGSGGSIDIYNDDVLAYTGEFTSASDDVFVDNGGGFIFTGDFTLGGYSGSGLLDIFNAQSTFHTDEGEVSFQGSATPEPSSLLLLGTGLLGFGPLIRRFRSWLRAAQLAARIAFRSDRGSRTTDAAEVVTYPNEETFRARRVAV